MLSYFKRNMLNIWNALRRTGREDIALRSIIANTIKDIYPREIDIHSVTFKGKKVFIKTGNNIANSELTLLGWKIQKESLERLSKVWISLSSEIKFLFL